MKLLVLGGTRFVGRAVVAEALARGWEVTALHRGVTGRLPPQVKVVYADREDPAVLAGALGAGTWDVVVDTWSGAPRVATTAAALLAGRVGRFVYISSGSVYAWGHHVDETSPVIEGDPQATVGEYGALKRGAELGVLASFPDALLVRAGLVLGPHEDIGRLPWWLGRIARGGPVIAPGRPQRPLQYLDARDLAAWTLSAAADGLSGAFDVASAPGHTTTAGLLEACITATGSHARLAWVDEEALAAAGVEPWTQLPCWVPERGDFAGFFDINTARAAAAGLVCRPVEETVADTWAWMQREPLPAQRADRDVHGLPEALERDLLDAVT